MDNHASGTNAGAGEPLSFEQLVSWDRPTDAQISPDGKLVAFCMRPVSNDEEHPKGSIWLVPFDGGEPRRITGGPGLDQSPRWSPDGTRIAFLSDRAERGKASVYLMRLDGGEAERVFEQQGDMGDLAWSPDGRHLAVLFTEPETDEEKRRKEERDDVKVWDTDYKFRRLWVIELNSGEARVVSPESRHVQEFCWSTDSGLLAVNTSATPRADESHFPSEVAVVNRQSGSITRSFALPASSTDLVWSPDGTCFAYRGAAGRVMHPDYVYAVDANGTERECLTPDFAGTVDSLMADRSGNLYFISSEGLNAATYALDWNGTPNRMSPHELDGKITPPFTLSSDASRAAFVREDATHAPNVWTLTRNDISPAISQQITHFNADLEAANLGSAEIVTWASDAGVEVQGLLIKPFGYVEGQRYPLLAFVHGGPTWHWSNQFPATWHDWGQMMASRGYAVLMPNPRGSTGRGPGFSNAIFDDVGGGEYRDLMTGVDAMIERGIADPDRLGVGGWSWGGYMTAWVVSQTDRFKAAVMGAGLPNMISDNSMGDIPSANLSYFEKSPYEDPEPYWERSAIRYIRNAKTPTLILHGEADDRVHPGQGREMYVALRMVGVETQFVTYPREGHRIMERKHQLDLMGRIVDWYERFLKPGA